MPDPLQWLRENRWPWEQPTGQPGGFDWRAIAPVHPASQLASRFFPRQQPPAPPTGSQAFEPPAGAVPGTSWQARMRITPPPVEEEEDINALMLKGEEIIPGVLMRLPDGRYVNVVTSYLIDPATALGMIQDYQDDPGISDYERERLAQEQQRIELDRQRLEWQMGQEGEDPRLAELQRRLQESELRSEMARDVDWIGLWQLDYNREMRGLRQARTGASRAMDAFKQPGIGTPDPKLPGELQQRSAGAEARFNKLVEKEKALSQQIEELEEQRNPPAPEWIIPYVPGLKAGEPITKQAIPTPSGQMWTRMPWEERMGLRSFANWSMAEEGRGRSRDVKTMPWTTMLEQMEQMLPGEPRPARQRRWQPARQ